MDNRGDFGNNMCHRPKCLLALSIPALLILFVGVILQSIAISGKTKWDTFETILKSSYLKNHAAEISAYQTLYDEVVIKDIPDKKRSLIPSVYPIKQGEFNNGWKDKIITYETTSQALGIGAFVILENALVLNVLNPDGRFSRICQPIAMVISMSSCLSAGVLSILGAKKYGDDFQKVLYSKSGPPRVINQINQLIKYGFNYNFEDNLLSTGYYMVLSAGGLFCLTGVLLFVILILYTIGRHNETKKTKVENNENE